MDKILHQSIWLKHCMQLTGHFSICSILSIGSVKRNDYVDIRVQETSLSSRTMIRTLKQHSIV